MEKISVFDMFTGDAYGANPDFAGIKNLGTVGVIHRATSGSSFIDSSYTARRASAIAAGLLWGAYHTLDASDVTTQAANFVAKVFDVGFPPTCLVVDLAGGSQPAAIHQLYSFCSQIDHASPPQYQVAVRGDDYMRTVLFSEPVGGYKSQVMIGYLDFLKIHRIWLNDKQPPATYSNTPPFPWTSLWLRRYELPFGNPIYRVGHVYNGDPATLPDHWIA